MGKEVVALLGIVVAIVMGILAFPVVQLRLGLVDPVQKVTIVPVPESRTPNEKQPTDATLPTPLDRNVRDSAKPPETPPSSENSDRAEIAAFRWKLQNAYNRLFATGDNTAVLNLSVDALIASADDRRMLEETGNRIRDLIRERGATTVLNFTAWTIQSLETDSASVACSWVTRGQERGRPPEELSSSGVMKLAKINGKWLLASGGKIF